MNIKIKKKHFLNILWKIYEIHKYIDTNAFNKFNLKNIKLY